MQTDTLHTDFLRLNYQRTDFLINRSQFISSLFLEKEIKIKSSIKYFHSITRFNDEYLLIFDFDTFLHNSFQFQENNSARLVLITDIAGFSGEHRRIVNRLNLKGSRNPRFSNNFLAIKVSNNAEIIRIALRELRLIPATLRQKQTCNGILGIRFPDRSSIQYFIDSETMIINNILSRQVIG